MSCIASLHGGLFLQNVNGASNQLRVPGRQVLSGQWARGCRQSWSRSCPNFARKVAPICHAQSSNRQHAPADNSHNKPTKSKSTKILSIWWQQAASAAGALFIFMMLVRPIATRWQRAHRPIADPTPAAIWLPTTAVDQNVESSEQPTSEVQAPMYAAISSSIPATSSRLLRMSDACLMRMTVTLQQVISSSWHLPHIAPVTSLLPAPADDHRPCTTDSHHCHALPSLYSCRCCWLTYWSRLERCSQLLFH